ncbi:hypothetical protein [Roseivirga sp. UBA1976]|uniref:hypothetical protein n=1 Tax=Roseivirga sp. UBA1976 TaxID=1947386 RepID=UPI0025794468|nr:hypothetical protein [Roseivirga sp. UBA1976]MEC7753980.1 hypothetical protein [Bacteroidota bacterium]
MKSNFLKSSSWSFTAVVFRALGGFTINKLFAVMLGTSGITLLSHFQNLTSLFTLLPSEGVNRSIMKYWSDETLTEEERKRVFKTGFWVTALLFSITLGLLFFWKQDYFFDRFMQEMSPSRFLLIFVPSVFLMLMSGYLNSVILALRKVKTYAIINIVGLVLLVAVVYGGVKFGAIDMALLSFAIGYGLMAFVALGYLLAKRRSIKLGFGSPDKQSFQRIWKFVLMAISAIVFGRLLDFAVRDYVIDLYGLDRTGLWQSVAKMSTSYLLVFTGTVGVVYYPKMASLIHEPGALKSYVLKVMGFVAFVTVLCLGVYYLNKEFFLKLFFSQGFERAAYLVRYQVIGDFFAILSYLLAYVLSARVETVKYIGAQFVSAIIYLGTVGLLIDHFELEALTLGYLWRYLGFFIVLIIFNRRLLFR